MTLLLITVRLWSRLGFDPRSRIISITYNDFHDEIRYNLYCGFQLCNCFTFLWSRIDYDFRSGFIMGFIVEIVLGRYHRRRGIGVAPTTPILIYFNKKEYMWLMTNWSTGEAKSVCISRLLRIMTRSNKDHRRFWIIKISRRDAPHEPFIICNGSWVKIRLNHIPKCKLV